MAPDFKEHLFTWKEETYLLRTINKYNKTINTVTLKCTVFTPYICLYLIYYVVAILLGQYRNKYVLLTTYPRPTTLLSLALNKQ